MTLPASGAISLSQVNTELGLSSTATISLNDSAVRTLFGVASGAISMSNGYGKANQFAFTISANQTNANLASLATAAGWNGTSKVVATINSGVYISSNSTGTPALTVSGSFPGGVELINNGYIVGRGGNGGAGRSISSGNGSGGAAGSAGGVALSVSSAITINNAGTIAGGGGGGGGGSANYTYFLDKGTYYYTSVSGGGGGGGRSSAAANSSGGAAGVATANWSAVQGSAGSAGTVSSAGGGGAGGNTGGATAGYGGAGGGWGSSGASGGAGGPGTSVGGPFSGGSAGNAVTGNVYVSWSATGTRLGGIS